MGNVSNIFHEHNGYPKHKLARVRGAKRHAKKKLIRKGIL